MQTEDKRAGFVGPLKAFVILICVLATLAVIAMFVSPSGSEEQITTSGTAIAPDHSLTNAEAIARFKELKKLRDQAYQHRDTSLVPMIYTSDSRVGEDVRREINQLLRDNVVPRTKFITRRASVTSNEERAIEILQVVDVYPRFVSEQGEDVTRSGRPERHEVEWTLRLERSEWLVDDVLIVESRSLRSRSQ